MYKYCSWSSCNYLSLFFSERVQLNEEKVSTLRDIILSYDSTLPPLIRDWASLKTSRVLHGDYDLKLKRQEYYLSKKDEVLNKTRKTRLTGFSHVDHCSIERSTRTSRTHFIVIRGGASLP